MNRPARTAALAALALLAASGCTASHAHSRPQTTAAAVTPVSPVTPGATAWHGGFREFGTPQWKRTWGVVDQGAWGAADFAAVEDPSAPGGAGALQVTYGAGSSANSCTDCPNPGGGQFYTDLTTLGLPALAQSPALDLKYALKFPAGRDWGKAGKLPGLYGGKIGEESGGTHGSGWSTRYMWRAAKGTPDNGEVYLYTPTNSGPTGYGVDEGLGDWRFQADDHWHTVEQLIDRTTGDITVWYDGHQVHHTSGTASGIAALPFAGILFSTFYGGHDTSWGPATPQHAWFADFSLSTGPQHP